MTCICLKCGYNMDREQPISDGPFSFDPGVPSFTVDDVPLPRAGQMTDILGSVMQARGRTLSFAVLAERMGYEGDNPRNIVNTLTCRAKRMVRERGHPFPIERVRGVGLRWKLTAN
jgi:DNA-binding response OmpR family regulator